MPFLPLALPMYSEPIQNRNRKSDLTYNLDYAIDYPLHKAGLNKGK